MSNFRSGWYVIYTRPQHEKKVAVQLEMEGIGYYLPLIKSLRKWSDRRKYIDAPLFPSYIFVKLDDVQAYFRSLELTGVLQYVRSGKDIVNVQQQVISDLQQLIAAPCDEIIVSYDHILPGKKLVICEGPFTGFQCEMIRHNGKNKVLVRIDFIRRNVIADIAIENLLPASSAAAFA